MTRDDVLEIAREAGIRLASRSDAVDPRNVYLHEIERFAAFIAAHEREECAKLADSLGWVSVDDIRARGEK